MNRYEIQGKIADGTVCSVFKAYDRELKRYVAIKRVRADTPEEAECQAKQLVEEADKMARLRHPSIVQIFDVGSDEEGRFIVMELLEGETLEDIIGRGALFEQDFRELAIQSLEGMIAIHSAGLIHLDMEPQNFMVIWRPTGKFQIKIIDFDLSKFANQPRAQDTNGEGTIMGNIYFMAPEQIERSQVDARTDLYSLGCVYYFALAQHHPFRGETGPEIMASHMHHSVIPLAQMRPDLPPFLCQWVEWLMCRQPSQRPAAAADAHEIFLAGKLPSKSVTLKKETVRITLRARPRPGLTKPKDEDKQGTENSRGAADSLGGTQPKPKIAEGSAAGSDLPIVLPPPRLPPKPELTEAPADGSVVPIAKDPPTPQPPKPDKVRQPEMPPSPTEQSASKPQQQVFVSYSTHDLEFVEQVLAPIVREAGLVPWYSLDGIRVADNWERAIKQALEGSQQIMVVMSPNAANSEWVRLEVHWATEHRRNSIIPVMLADCSPWDIHMRLGNIQHVDFRENPVEARAKVLKLLGRLQLLQA